MFDLQGCEDWELPSDGKEKANTSMELLEKSLSDENLAEAMHAVMSNKGATGIDHMPTNKLPDYVAEHKEEICEMIRKRRYRPLPVKRVQIPKNDGSKRNLGIPAVKDRWIEQAVLKALEYMNDGYDWIVDLDLSKFFDKSKSRYFNDIGTQSN